MGEFGNKNCDRHRGTARYREQTTRPLSLNHSIINLTRENKHCIDPDQTETEYVEIWEQKLLQKLGNCMIQGATDATFNTSN